MDEIVDEPTVEHWQYIAHDGDDWGLAFMSNGLIRLHGNGFYVDSFETTMQCREYILAN